MKNSPNHVEFVLNVLNLIAQAYHEGDAHTLDLIDLTPAEATFLFELTPEQRRDLAELRSNIFQPPQIDHAALKIGRQIMARRAEEAKVQTELLQAQAPLALMQHLYGWPHEEHSLRRKRLGICVGHGRPHNLTDEQRTRSWELWSTLKASPEHERWLAIARAGIPLNSAYASICEHDKEYKDGGVAPAGADAGTGSSNKDNKKG